MNWRDLFYFSKGERRALTVLLLLITLSFLILQLTEEKIPSEYKEEKGTEKHLSVQHDTIKKTTKQSVPVKARKSSYRKKKEFLPRETKIPSERNFFSSQKYPKGTIVELNSADTTILKKVPGIGSTFARRIIRFRNLLGGFYSVTQLSEVYGIDSERYESIKSWFSADQSSIRLIKINHLSARELSKHPYINYKQAKTIERLVKQKSRLTGWENLQLLEEFTETDKERLAPYLSFE
ncbi:helix-hairpin-helix domain-containing protein [Parabacteroides bouchesdurhonensis]|uniref:helix-hairpin-helix domain-containing protein n=1 Tax=Parabacteroides bouchesdurhonensis TaxID=1936995 RepID=UPI000E4D4BD1|nr:helix-hairpin-helix domain-containing protein [Parabacteroides bouchesdurhonensis]RHJ94139.1 helix-hairpin-helix domain-containing protein [Bacteroides sp. AM07-16]